MAQDFVGSNNLNLLAPCGQFGTRIMGGKDAASPRYIFTKLENVARKVFHPDDDFVLNYLDDDGQSIEPNYYVPVLPLALCNGADGIGTGWATSVPNYDPKQLIAVLRQMIAHAGDDVDCDETSLLATCAAEDVGADGLAPSYRGFKGDVILKKAGSYQALGRVERLDDTKVLIDELPLRKWTHDYKQWLEQQIVGDDKTTAWLKDFKENHTDTTVSFTVTALSGAKLDEAEKAPGGLLKKFKLESSMATSNMNFFDSGGATRRHPIPTRRRRRCGLAEPPRRRHDRSRTCRPYAAAATRCPAQAWRLSATVRPSTSARRSTRFAWRRTRSARPIW
jgi:DNA topoisomerase-2